MKIIVILQLFCFSTFSMPTSEGAFPVFLKIGFSSILEFDEVPIRIVLGDSQSFQIEKMERSLVIRTLVPYGITNMFVYFNKSSQQIFTLTADEDANPTVYRRIESLKPIKTAEKKLTYKSKKQKKGAYFSSLSWDKEKDYLTIDGLISSDEESILIPKWDLIRLTSNSNKIVPYKVWSARKSIQKDSTVKFRLVFLRPNIEKDLKKSFIVIPLEGKMESLHLMLKKEK